ncbi:MAG: hypothetical protein QOI80_3513, partial [Solirubrobacteraceae bacterium]|nr:hypothetical protein [Solirubrobacteraceae bacterium]
MGGANAAHCGSQTGDAFLSASDAQSACEAGAGLGVALILFVGFVGFVFFALIWFMTRPRTAAPAPVATAAPAGFYVDPSNTTAERYWDGARWTEQTRPASPPVPIG